MKPPQKNKKKHYRNKSKQHYSKNNISDEEEIYENPLALDEEEILHRKEMQLKYRDRAKDRRENANKQ